MASPPEPPAAVGTLPPPPSHRVPVWPVVAVVLGALVLLVGLALTAGGGALVWAHATQRDADGFYTTPTERLETTTYAITSDAVDLGREGEDWPLDLGDLATVRLSARSTSDGAVFVGIGREQDVEAYLASVAHAEIARLDFDPFRVEYDYRRGDQAPAAPTAQDFWAASASGEGRQTLDWEPSGGRWMAVVMNADGARSVSVDVAAGAEVPWLLGLGIGLLVAGALGLLVGGVLLVVGVVGLARAQHLDLGAPAPVEGRPVRLEGDLDEPLSRWLWLVKWILLIPHLLVLLVLWLAFAVVTVVAFFAVLFTASYPRALFDFNVGVLRWTWRVTYYGYSALGTDRYPPFTLGPAPDYPARLEIDRPERLSRGLVLVKWWLLAIPHYLVLALIWGGAAASSDVELAASVGLVGLLVLFAAVALLFTGRYPRGMFDLVVGLNRWGYRVVAYVTLLRDDYPPFRLDQGGSEPAPPRPPPPGDDRGAAEEPVATAGV
jgi:hypothetical protein